VLSPPSLSHSFKIKEANPEGLLSIQEKPEKQRVMDPMLTCRQAIPSSLPAQISKL